MTPAMGPAAAGAHPRRRRRAPPAGRCHWVTSSHWTTAKTPRAVPAAARTTSASGPRPHRPPWCRSGALGPSWAGHLRRGNAGSTHPTSASRCTRRSRTLSSMCRRPRRSAGCGPRHGDFDIILTHLSSLASTTAVPNGPRGHRHATRCSVLGARCLVPIGVLSALLCPNWGLLSGNIGIILSVWDRFAHIFPSATPHMHGSSNA